MNICLVRLPSPFLLEDHLFPPLGLMSVGTVLKKLGHDVVIYDGPVKDVPIGYQCYGVGPTIPEYQDAITVLKKIKNYNRRTKFIIGGPYATIRPKKCFEDGFDCVVRYDGETAVQEAIEDCYPIIKGEEKELKSYPIIDRSLVNIYDYKYYLDDILATTISTGRGCPFNCGFCSKNHCSVRLAPADYVIKEIDYLHEEFGYKALAFPEDLFILNKSRAEKIFQHMNKKNIISRCLVRADVVVKHGQGFSDFMFSHGCYHVGIGVESGSDTILKNINKGESVSTIKKAIKILNNSNIMVKGFFIVGLPGESQETIDETKKFLDEMNLFDVDIKIFQPYPGSPIYENKEEYDINWDDDQEKSTMFYKGRPSEYYGSIRTSSLSTNQIYSEWEKMEKDYKKW